MTKGYVILEKSYEYNDEIYYLSSGGGTPQHVITNKEAAIKEARRLNANAFNGLELYCYCYDINELLQPMYNGREEDVIAKLTEIIGQQISLDEFKVPFGLSQEKLEQIADLFDLEFFTVEEVEID